MSGSTFPMILSSIQLHGLTAICHYSFPENVQAEASDFGPFTIVMEDGSTVTAEPKSGGIYGIAGSGVYSAGHCTYLFDSPVVFSQIDHLLLADGRIVPVNIP